jgi:predicted HicB family RNase H-like nuclease
MSKKQHKGPGQPRKADACTAKLEFRVRPETKVAAQAKAADRGVSVSTWLRKLVERITGT